MSTASRPSPWGSVPLARVLRVRLSVLTATVVVTWIKSMPKALSPSLTGNVQLLPTVMVQELPGPEWILPDA